MPVALRTDFDAVACRLAAKRSKDGPQARRLLTLAAIYEGASRSEAARIGGVTVQIVRDWVVKFNSRGSEGLIDRKAPGRPPRLNAEHRAALAGMIESGPMPAIVLYRPGSDLAWVRRATPGSGPAIATRT